MTVRKQILLLLVAFSVIPTLALTAVSLSSNLKNIENLHKDRLNAITKTSAAAFSEIIGLRKDELNLLASSWSMLDYLKMKERDSGDDGETRAALDAVGENFKVYIDSLGTFADLVLLDGTGKVILGYKPKSIGLDLSGMDYFAKVKNVREENYVFSSKVHSSLLQPNNPDVRCLAFSSALRAENGNLLAVLVAFVDVNIMAGFSKSISFGQTGLAFLIDSDNYILYHPEPRFYNSYTAAPQLANLLDHWRSGDVPPTGLIDDVMDGKRRIYYYEIMPKSQLIFILRQDHDEFSAERNSAIRFAVFACLFTATLAVTLGLVFSKRLMAPIMKLKEAFASGGEESAYVSVDLPLKNELGDMAESYNSMIKKLERQYDQIKAEKDKNEFNAMHDGITGLCNRMALERELSQYMAESIKFGVFYIDIDNFKKINYVLGHMIGDELLRAVGGRLRASKGEFDICARIGGDEFVLARKGSAEDMRRSAEMLLEELRQPIVFGDVTFFVTVSVGIAMYPDHGASTDNLIANSDIAMFKAKENGKNLFAIYNPDMRGNLDRHNIIMDVLRGCIEDREVFFMYQPIYDAANEKILGFETLMRIKSVKLGLVSPVEFVPVAETDKVMMARLGHIALQEACGFMARLIAEKDFTGYIAVNISSVQLNQDDFVESVLNLLAESAIPAGRLQLEITESVMTGVRVSHLEKLTALRKAGVLIALDDFGAGDSSFYHFINLPIDVLKIDRTFFESTDSNERVELMNKTIIDLARNFGLSIVAECVESNNDRDMLKRLGCEVIQGFVYSKPLLEDRAINLLTK